jgi:hypothetical protein
LILQKQLMKVPALLRFSRLPVASFLYEFALNSQKGSLITQFLPVVDFAFVAPASFLTYDFAQAGVQIWNSTNAA